MPVVIALLNSYSGLAAAAAGFVLDNMVLIISGSLVGASGFILTRIMCIAMNRSIWNVMFGAFGAQATGPDQAGSEGRQAQSTTAEDSSIVLAYAKSVIFVPGYGLAAAQAQHQVKELADPAAVEGRRGEARDSSGGGQDAWPHERAARRGGRAVRPAVRDGGHQRRLRPARTLRWWSAPTT